MLENRDTSDASRSKEQDGTLISQLSPEEMSEYLKTAARSNESTKDLEQSGLLPSVSLFDDEAGEQANKPSNAQAAAEVHRATSDRGTAAAGDSSTPADRTGGQTTEGDSAQDTKPLQQVDIPGVTFRVFDDHMELETLGDLDSTVKFRLNNPDSAAYKQGDFGNISMTQTMVDPDGNSKTEEIFNAKIQKDEQGNLYATDASGNKFTLKFDPDKNTFSVLSDEFSVYGDKDGIWMSQDGDTVYYQRDEDKGWKVFTEDGMTTCSNDGTQWKTDDKGVSIKYPGDVELRRNNDGTTTVDFSDQIGQVQIDKDSKLTIVDPDGNVIEAELDENGNQVIEFDDDTRVTLKPDGSLEISMKEGRVKSTITIKPDNEMTSTYAIGSDSKTSTYKPYVPSNQSGPGGSGGSDGPRTGDPLNYTHTGDNWQEFWKKHWGWLDDFLPPPQEELEE